MHFDARISGVPDYCNLVRSQLGRDEARYQVKKMRAARDEIVRLLGSSQKKTVNELFRRKHESAAHLYLEQDMLLKPLHGWLSRHSAEFRARSSSPQPSDAGTLTTNSDPSLSASRSGNSSAVLQSVKVSQTASTASLPPRGAHAGLRTLTSLGLNDALIVPLEMPKPLSLALKIRAYRLPVVSAQALIRELDTIERRLGTGKAFRVPQVGDFIYARAADVQRLASMEGLGDRFWVRFAAVILRHLAKRSIELGLCAHISDRPLAPCV